MGSRVSVSSADFIRNIGHWQNEALRRPISITHHGRERLVLTTPDALTALAASDADVTAAVDQLRADADAVLESLESGYLAFDADLRLVRANRAAEAFFGRSRESLEGAKIGDFAPSPFSLMLHERLQRALRGRRSETFDAAVAERHASVRVFPLSQGVAAVLANTTELHEQRVSSGLGAALSAATDQHPSIAAIELDTRGCVTGVHDSFCAWSGFAREEIVGRRLIDLAPACHRREISEALQGAALDAAPPPLEVTLLGRQGQEVSGFLSLAPIRTEDATHGLMAVWVRADDDAIGARRMA